MDFNNINIAGFDGIIDILVIVAIIIVPNVLEAYFNKQKKAAQRKRRVSQTDNTPSVESPSSIGDTYNDSTSTIDTVTDEVKSRKAVERDEKIKKTLEDFFDIKFPEEEETQTISNEDVIIEDYAREEVHQEKEKNTIAPSREKSIQDIYQEKIVEREKAKKIREEKIRKRNQEIQLARAAEIRDRKKDTSSEMSLNVIEQGEINGEICDNTAISFNSDKAGRKSKTAKKGRKSIDKRNLIIYSEIMKPKFAD